MSRSKHARGWTHHWDGKYTKYERHELKRKYRARTRQRMHREQWAAVDTSAREIEGWWLGW